MHTGIKLITILLLFAAAPQVGHAQGLGLSLGANFHELSDIDTQDRQATFDNVSGWHAHLWFDLPLGPVSLRPGIRYMNLGEIFQDATLEDRLQGIDEDQVVSLLEIPIDVRLKLGMPIITPYIVAGPVLRFPANPSDDENRLESFSLAAGAGVGVEVGLGGIRLFPELKYTFGITRFTKEEYQLGGVTIRPDEDQRLNAVMVSVGIGL